MTSAKGQKVTGDDVARTYDSLMAADLEARGDNREQVWAAIQRKMTPVAQPAPMARPWIAALSVAFVGAASLTIALGSWKSAPDEAANALYVVEGVSAEPLRVASQESKLVATEGNSARIVFADQSEIRLEPHTTLRLTPGPSHQVRLNLAQGKLGVKVAHHEDTDYRFQAGSFEVRVVGTAFDLAYRPDGSQFDLVMHEGRVLLTDAQGKVRPVVSGEAVHSPEAGPVGVEAVVAEDAVGTLDESGRARLPQGAQRATAAVPSYKELARKGLFREIVRLAEKEGVANVLGRRSASEIQELAQAARYSGRSDLAAMAFSRLESGFGSTAVGQNAPFFLGRMAEDAGRTADALRRYSSYLAASPGGSYAAEAMGRKMVILQRLGRQSEASTIATAYLARHPTGPYRAVALSLASRTSGGQALRPAVGGTPSQQ